MIHALMKALVLNGALISRQANLVSTPPWRLVGKRSTSILMTWKPVISQCGRKLWWAVHPLLVPVTVLLPATVSKVSTPCSFFVILHSFWAVLCIPWKMQFLYPCLMKLEGGILDSPCPSVPPFVRLSVFYIQESAFEKIQAIQFSSQCVKRIIIINP